MRWWCTALVAVLVSLGCGGTPAPAASPGAGAGQNVGKVEFLSSLGQPAQEVQSMQAKVLAGFNGSADFNSQPTASQDIDRILSEQKAGKSTIDVTALLHSDMITLQAS